MKEKTGKKREAPISYRPPASMREAFNARVQRSGLSANAYITQCLFDRPAPRQSRRPPVETQQLARLLAEAAGIRGRLDDIAKAGSNIDPALHEAACRDLTEIRTAIFSLLGRRS